MHSRGFQLESSKVTTTNRDSRSETRRKRQRVVHQAIVNYRIDPKRAVDRDVRPIDWSWADMPGIDASGGHLAGADLSNADLSQSRLDGANLTSARLIAATLDNTSLVGADLSKANLLNAGLEGADLRGARLQNANLTGADLTHARLLGADLTGAILTNANLSSTNFVSDDDFEPIGEQAVVRGLTQAQIDSACMKYGARPSFDDLVDAGTGKRLIWRDRVCP